MPINLILPGHEVPSKSLEPGLADFLAVEIVRTHLIERQTRGSEPRVYMPVEADEDDIVELQWHNDVTQWLSVAQLRADPRLNAAIRGADADAVQIPLHAPYGRTARNATDWVLKGLKILKISPAEALATASAQAIVAHFEGKLSPGPGLYRLDTPVALGSQIHAPEDLPGADPWLVLLPGTFSWTTASFGALADTSEWTSLQQRYGDRVLAFDHRTLSQSPIQNALDLVRLLPDRATLHLVSHSRGGLVGELLCLRPLTNADLRPFRARGRDADAEALLELSQLLSDKQVNIPRFVRVACPARGTLLASKRLDTYLSILVNLLGKLPFPVPSPLYSFVKATLLALVSRRTDPREVPGLEAQMPESPLIHLLNRPGVVAKADLAVIAGDIEGAGFWGHLKTFATDVFYREDHDLVVNTAAMYGGMGRERGAYYFFDSGAEVHHFNYFLNSSTRQRLLSWLTRDPQDEPPPDFQQIVRTRQGSVQVRAARSSEDQAIVVLIPDLLGSHIAGPNGRIWFDYDVLMRDGLSSLASLDDPTYPDDVVASPYQQLTDRLAAQYHVVPLAYDWRRSIVDERTRLGSLLQAELGRHDRPIFLVAHGMGSRLVQAMIAGERGLWEQVIQRGGRLVMLGPPSAAAHAALDILLGRAAITRLLEFVSPDQDHAAIVRMFRSFPGLLELLPGDPSGLYFTSKWWQQADGSPPTASRLKQARSVREAVQRVLDPAHMACIAGRIPLTETTIGNSDVQTVAEFAAPATIPTWYVDARHGDLPTTDDAVDAVIELLAQGRANRLAAHPSLSSLRRDISITPEQPLLFPTEDELVAAALGRTLAPDSSEAPWTVQVSVTHGHLRQARHPLAIGHYEGDTLVSAEAVLNDQLNGRLAQRFQMNLYPGPADTVEVIDAPGCYPPGALIIGLGTIGTISPEKLRRGVTVAALRYALTVADRAEPSTDGWRSAAFSTVLIGTQGGGALTQLQSLQAIVAGALLANRALRAQNLWQRVRIDAVECLELYEDLAIEALRALQGLNRRPPIALESSERLAIADVLHVSEGGLYQRPANPYVTGWWRRLQISEQPKSNDDPACDLRFLSLTDRARAEETLRYTQRAVIEEVVKASIQAHVYDSDLAATLFELLLPNAIKEQARDEGDIVLVVDQAAAAYPWELLAERIGDDIRPIVLQRSLIRQFTTATFRQNPRNPRENWALVVGDTESSLPDLPGAQREAQAVARSLTTAQFHMELLIRKEPGAILKKLFEHDYRILHLAGHGIYQPDKPVQSGMVLADGMYLTSAELGQLRVVPELVFINCCHLGSIDRTDAQANKLAASIARELIEMGVRAVVAAGWAVDDAAAATFATTFYDELLAGETFGRAVASARRKTHEQHMYSTTWGAYQCYGNPDWRLVQTGTPSYSTRTRSPRFVGRSEALDHLRSIKAEARGATPAQQHRLRTAADDWLPEIRQEWCDGQLLTFLGDFWAALGDFEQAISSYQKAIDAHDAYAPIKAIEQLANLQSRAAARSSDPVSATKQSIEQLEWLLKLGRTPERLAMLGANCKRLAQLASGDERVQWLHTSSTYYQAAHRANLDQRTFDPYPALNWVALCIILKDQPPDTLLKTIADSEQAASERERRSPSLYDRIALSNAALLRHLVKRDDRSKLEHVKQKYERALKSGFTVQELSSARDQLDFLSMMLEETDADAAEAISTIRAALADGPVPQPE